MKQERIIVNLSKIIFGIFFFLSGIRLYPRGDIGHGIGGGCFLGGLALIIHAIYRFNVEKKEKDAEIKKISWKVRRIIDWLFIAVLTLLLVLFIALYTKVLVI